MADLEGSNGERTEFKIVGKPNIPGRLSHVIATGKAKFAGDVVVPNMLHAKFLRSPYGRARIKSMDIGEAKALPGVVDILTWEDPDIQALQSMGMPRMWPGMPMLINEADMEDEEVGAVVVAESEELCDHALSLIKVEWEVLPHILDPREGMKPEAPVIRENPKGEGNVQTNEFLEGDIEAGFKEADQILEFDYSLSFFSSHIPNPAGGVAWWYDDPVGGEGQTLFIEGASPTRGGKQLCEMFKIPFDKIYQNTIFQGGKYCDWGLRRAAMITPLLAKKTGRPVRAMNNRQNMYDIAITARHAHEKAGFKNDGTLTAVLDTVVTDAGVRGSSNFGTTMDLIWNPFYTTKCQNTKTVAHTVNTNTGRMYVSGQHWPHNWDVLTITQQMIADRLGMDPIDVAIKNIHGPKSQTDESIPPSFKLCVEKGKEAINWEWHPAVTRKLPDGRMHGFSFRYQMSPRHAMETYSCTVSVKGDGKVYIPTKGPWCGIYGADACAMVVAEEMGARIEDVILAYDPKAIFTPVGGGSDGTTSSAWVSKEAAVACRKMLLERAAARLQVSPEDLDTGDSKVFFKSDTEKSFPFSHFAEWHDKDIAATYTGRPPIATWNTEKGKVLENMNATFCEVAVDIETGLVEVLQYVVVCDPGKVLRPTSLESQIFQVMNFSNGSGLLEDLVFDKRTGVKLNTNMIEYKKPTILDISPVDPILVETRSGNACYGASGISHSMATTHLIVCAVANAIDRWIGPPITPDKVLKALGKA